jgi:hypothetical protein
VGIFAGTGKRLGDLGDDVDKYAYCGLSDACWGRIDENCSDYRACVGFSVVAVSLDCPAFRACHRRPIRCGRFAKSIFFA